MDSSQSNRKERETIMPLNRNLRFPFFSKHRNKCCKNKQDEYDNSEIHHQWDSTNQIIAYFLEHTDTLISTILNRHLLLRSSLLNDNASRIVFNQVFFSDTPQGIIDLFWFRPF